MTKQYNNAWYSGGGCHEHPTYWSRITEWWVGDDLDVLQDCYEDPQCKLNADELHRLESR